MTKIKLSPDCKMLTKETTRYHNAEYINAVAYAFMRMQDLYITDEKFREIHKLISKI